jgi:hypothetical protein
VNRLDVFGLAVVAPFGDGGLEVAPLDPGMEIPGLGIPGLGDLPQDIKKEWFCTCEVYMEVQRVPSLANYDCSPNSAGVIGEGTGYDDNPFEDFARNKAFLAAFKDALKRSSKICSSCCSSIPTYLTHDCACIEIEIKPFLDKNRLFAE